MQKIMSFIIFISVATLIITSIHYYLWVRLVRDTGLEGMYKNIATYSIKALTISIPVSVLLSRMLPPSIAYPLLWGSFAWLGIMMWLFFSLLSVDVIKLVVFIFSKFSAANDEIVDMERRRFMSKFAAAGASALVLGLAGIGVKNYYGHAVVKKIKVLLTGLPETFKGFRIVQISDLHIGEMMTGAKLEKIVEQVNSLNPDLIAITGDLADGSTSQLLHEVTSLRDLKAKNGVYFVTGNHEYYSGVNSWVHEIQKMGIKVLNNENIKIKNGTDFFYIAGVTDHEAKRFGSEHAPDFNRALSGLEKDKKKILLAHQPLTVKEASEYGTDLVLAGHTHGGQIWPFHYLVFLQQPYLKGLYQFKDTTLYVNQGTGCWGPPMRVGSFNEITEVTLA